MPNTSKFDVNQIWLTTWLFVYVLESDHKTDPSGGAGGGGGILLADLSDYIYACFLISIINIRPIDIYITFFKDQTTDHTNVN